MRSFLTAILFASAPLMVLAQGYSNAPMVVVGGDAKAAPLPQNFPKAAITSIGEVVGGEKTETPESPPSPAAPANPAAAPAPASPENPASPEAPANPVSKLWPRDTVPIFMTSCVGFAPQKIQPCSCVITKLILAMPHDEFLAKSENNTIEQDQRLQSIRMECATAPQKKE